MLAGFYKSKLVLLVETVLLTFLPLVIIKQYPDVLAYRHWLMAAGLFYVGLFFKLEKINAKDLGFKPTSFQVGLQENLIFVLKASFAIFALYLILPIRWVVPIGVTGVSVTPAWFHALRYIFISVPLQEILYRSYLINRAERVLPQPLVKLYATIIFMIVHSPFTTPVMSLGTLFLGWFWVGSFLKHRNIYAIYIAHNLVGLVYFAFLYFSTLTK